MLDNTLTIAGRQFRSYFNRPVAYIVLGLALLFLGFFFWKPFFLYGRATAREMFRYLSLVTTFVAPMLTMGLLADEKRSGCGLPRRALARERRVVVEVDGGAAPQDRALGAHRE